MPNLYCSTFDQNYLARALVLYESVVSNNDSAVFVFCCIDDISVELLKKLALPRSIILSFECYASLELTAVRPLRAYGEFCWTCKPVAQKFLMNRYPEFDWIVYLDADMMCFGDPDLGLPGNAYDYVLTPHRFHIHQKGYEKSVGIYNGGYVAARNSRQGQQVIDFWERKCLENCSAVPSEYVYGDQKYLNYFAQEVDGCFISENKGLNAAPWNILNYNVSHLLGDVYLDSTRLLIYHFQGFKVYSNGRASLYTGDWVVPRHIATYIYGPYVDALHKAYCGLGKLAPYFSGGIYPKPRGRYGFISTALSWIRMFPNIVNINK